MFNELFCDGIWGPNDYLGEKASIDFQLTPISATGRISLAIFNIKDLARLTWCQDKEVSSGICNSTELGLIHVNSTESTEDLLHETITWDDANKTTARYVYNVKNTGFYCTVVMAVGLMEPRDFTTTRVVKNPYGLLDAYLYPALPFYRTLSIIYSVIGIGWITLSFLYWKELLLIQHYVSLIILFLVTEMAFNYGFFESYNQTGAPNKVLLGIMTILNSGRVSASFFMLLIVSLGYGVVKPTLGTTMNKCVALAIIHFIFNSIYNLILRSKEPNSTLELLFAIPLSLIMTTFYMWILNGITSNRN